MQALIIVFRQEYNNQVARIDEKLSLLSHDTRWPQTTDVPMHYECLYLSGGGSVGATGNLPAPILKKPDRCKAVFDWYFADVRTLQISVHELICSRTWCLIDLASMILGRLASNLKVHALSESLFGEVALSHARIHSCMCFVQPSLLLVHASSQRLFDVASLHSTLRSVKKWRRIRHTLRHPGDGRIFLAVYALSDADSSFKCLCTALLQGDGQYWADLARISNEAIAYFTAQKTFKQDGTDMIVFDIDETTLSNVASIRANGYSSGAASKSSASDEPQQRFAPALDAIRDVYLAAYKYGISVRSCELDYLGGPHQVIVVVCSASLIIPQGCRSARIWHSSCVVRGV
jgi:hypothetical protein